MDDLFGFKEKEMEFFSVHSIREYSNDLDNGKEDTITSIFIRIDN